MTAMGDATADLWTLSVVPMIALLILTRRRKVMDSFASGFLAMAAAAIMLALNLLLVLQIAEVLLPAFASAG